MDHNNKSSRTSSFLLFHLMDHNFPSSLVGDHSSRIIKHIRSRIKEPTRSRKGLLHPHYKKIMILQ
ncbi:unnamed protein product [Brassica oleracea var. botrytis]